MSMPDYAQPNKPLLLIEAFEPLRTYRLVGEMDLSNSSWVGAALDRQATDPGDLTLSTSSASSSLMGQAGWRWPGSQANSGGGTG
jgi:hypothetical protein